MRKTLSKEELVTPKSVKYLYDTKIGGLILKVSTCRFVSKIAGWYLDTRLSKWLIKKYIKNNSIDMSQFIEEEYKCFNDFFTRRIKQEKRPFICNEELLPSPCDGKVSAYYIDKTTSYNIKGYDYTVESLLKNKELAEKYKNGICLVLRLSVEDYHRYFYLDNCSKGINVFIKGKLHTVQPYALEKRRVFSENCREYTIMHTENFGIVTQVEVGAMMVGRIVNNHQEGNFSRGEEKGKFEFGGSTIVLLFESDKVEIDEEFFINTKADKETYVKCGECIGRKKTRLLK